MAFCCGNNSTPKSAVKAQEMNTEKVTRTADEWRMRLSRKEHAVLRERGTEPAGAGEYNKFAPRVGYFSCRGCAAPLYSAKSKFACSCGWPAFDRAYTGFVATSSDASHGMSRTEITCAMCSSHLGHVFSGEGMTSTNQRHCVNSLAIRYVGTGPQRVLEEGRV